MTDARRRSEEMGGSSPGDDLVTTGGGPATEPPSGPLARSGAPGTSGWRTSPRPAVVEEFDEARGLGVLRDDDGRRFPFHCTALADGSRRVDTGAAVRFTVVAGHHGRLEAGGIAVEPR